MKKRALLLTLIAATGLCYSPADAKPRMDVVRSYTIWDDDFFYAAFDVNDPDIQGQSAQPNNAVGENDDAVAVYLQADRAKDARIGPSSYRMIVSAAGGAQFSVGQNGTWVQRTITTFKYAIKREGTLNNDQDDDVRYTVEMAIPWSELGIKPEIGTATGVNIVVQMAGEHKGFLSVSPDVKMDVDRDSPAKWLELWLRGQVQPLVVNSPGRLFVNKTVNRRVVVDGRPTPAEFPEKNVIVLQKPPIQSAKHIFRDFPVEEMVFAPLKLKQSTPTSQMINRPFWGTDAFADATNVSAIRTLLTDARRAGIDVLAVEYSGSEDIQLIGLLAALRELDKASEDHPLVTLWLKPSDGAVKSDLIKRFFSAIPAEYRVQIRKPASRGGNNAIAIFYQGTPVSDAERKAVSQQVMALYGSEVIWVSDDPAADAVLPETVSDSGSGASEGGWIKLAVVTPGGKRNEKILSRRDGELFDEAWKAATEAKPDWALLDSLNDYLNGTQIAPSVEHGYLYNDAAGMQSLKFSGMREYSARFLSASVPPTIASNSVATAQFKVRNVGTRAWKVVDRIMVGYRWYQGGRLYSPGAFQTNLQRDVAVNGISDINIGLATVDTDKDPLPEGDWLLVIDLFTADGQPFSGLGDKPLAVPVRIGASPPQLASIIDTTIPAVMQTGTTYPVNISVRNDGSAAWSPANNTALSISLYNNPLEQTASHKWVVAVPTEIQPGRIGTVSSTIDLTKLVLPAGIYYLETTLQSDTKAATGYAGRTAVYIGQPDLTARIIGPEKPIPAMTYSTKAQVDVFVVNRSAVEWKSGATLNAVWYSLDGTRLINNGGEGRIKSSVKPGQTVAAKLELTPPPYPGQYMVRWTLTVNGVQLEQGAIKSREDSVFVQYVTVNGPAVETAQLASLFDTDLQISESDETPGEMSEGLAFPAEAIPPLVVPTAISTPIYPVGLYEPDRGGVKFADADTVKWIGFSWPSKTAGSNNAITAKGQTVQAYGKAVRRVHILATAVDTSKGTFKLTYSNGSENQDATVGSWRKAAEGDAVAFRTNYLRTKEGSDVAGQGVFYCLTLNTDPARPLTSITLPDNPAIRVLAVSFENASN